MRSHEVMWDASVYESSPVSLFAVGDTVRRASREMRQHGAIESCR